MAAKKTAGEKGEFPISKKAVMIAEDGPFVPAEKFPADFKESLALLQELSAEPVSTEQEWLDKQPRLHALKAHVFKIQQGSPVLPISSNDHASAYEFRRQNEKRAKLEILGRTHYEVKDLLAERDALAKQISESTKTAES